MRKILFISPSKNIHTIWREWLRNPLEGYEFVAKKNKIDLDKMSNLKNNKLINFFYKKFIKNFFSPLQLNERFVSIPKCVDLIYSPDMIVKKKFPWVCDTEEAICFAGNDAQLLKKRKREIEKALGSKYCKKIMPFTEFGKKSLEREFDCSKFRDKIEVVHITANIPKITLKKDPKIVNILFVGTIHHPSLFNLRGGRELIEAFKILYEKYKNIKLNIISKIPKEIDTNFPGIKVFPLMEREKVFELYAKSDIFLAPSYLAFGMTFVEALGFGIPLIVTDMSGIAESVDKNGLIIHIKNKGQYEFIGPSISKYKDLENFIYKHNKNEIIENIVKTVSKLIENPKLMRQMGIESRKKYEEEFSIEYRNKKLKRIFDEAIEDSKGYV